MTRKAKDGTKQKREVTDATREKLRAAMKGRKHDPATGKLLKRDEAPAPSTVTARGSSASGGDAETDDVARAADLDADELEQGARGSGSSAA